MSSPGRKWILNTWVFNFESLAPQLEKALEYESTRIEITTLKPDSLHGIQRGAELNRDVKSVIETNLDDLAFFLDRLPENMRSRVRVYEFDAVPKFIIYGSDDTALVGHFWPKQHAAHGPHLVIEGQAGTFARHVRKYYNELDRRDITKEILQRNDRKQEQMDGSSGRR